MSRTETSSSNIRQPDVLPNVIESQSGLSFAEFFQNARDTSRKGIVVVDLSKGDAS